MPFTGRIVLTPTLTGHTQLYTDDGVVNLNVTDDHFTPATGDTLQLGGVVFRVLGVHWRIVDTPGLLAETHQYTRCVRLEKIDVEAAPLDLR